jgi:hypothetical protein
METDTGHKGVAGQIPGLFRRNDTVSPSEAKRSHGDTKRKGVKRKKNREIDTENDALVVFFSQFIRRISHAFDIHFTRFMSNPLKTIAWVISILAAFLWWGFGVVCIIRGLPAGGIGVMLFTMGIAEGTGISPLALAVNFVLLTLETVLALLFARLVLEGCAVIFRTEKHLRDLREIKSHLHVLRDIEEHLRVLREKSEK